MLSLKDNILKENLNFKSPHKELSLKKSDQVEPVSLHSLLEQESELWSKKEDSQLNIKDN